MSKKKTKRKLDGLGKANHAKKKGGEDGQKEGRKEGRKE